MFICLGVTCLCTFQDVAYHVGKNKNDLGNKFPLMVTEPSTSGVAFRDWTVRSKEKFD